MAKRKPKSALPVFKNGLVGNSNFVESASGYAANVQAYENRFINMSVSMFEWSGLPETVDARYIEMMLYFYGAVVFFNDDAIGFIALQGMPDNTIDIYGNPLTWRGIGANGVQYTGLITSETLKAEDVMPNAVIIYNNYCKTGSVLDMKIYSERLANLDITTDINTAAQKTPVLITCDENERLSMLNLYKEYAGGAPVIYGSTAIRSDSVQVLSTGAQFIGKDLQDVKAQIWNEALTALGVNNVTYQKKERMISDEVTRAQGGTIANRQSRLAMRQRAADQINKFFGLNVSVKYRDEYHISDEPDEKDQGEEQKDQEEPQYNYYEDSWDWGE